MKNHSFTLLSSVRIAEATYDLRVLAPDVSFRAGQFVHIKCDGHTLRRPISVCDFDGEILRLAVTVRGDGTAWLVSRSKLTILDVLAPLGNGFEAEGKNVLIVGGGIGVAPLLFAAKTAHRADAVLGFRSSSAVLLLGDFKDACGTVRLCTDDGSLGACGRVDTLLKATDLSCYDAVLACGPHAMLKAVAAACDAPLRVSLEERMACGVGACLGCAVLMADGRYCHVCKDGPVFDAREVVL